ncbi:PilN domain-containing protein [Marinobacter salinexigens]|uniref:PilN domain-containing protein n=1 Tax=Marinobacter salinexigens TaxID=2919747 RepID=A0A5B0VB13_9GAMM|nr:PilN domain-containing protein [Marinobacter salinexigens]KAA1171654.1 PilN domain-containing protein [Marinobacter salinexigens]
MANINLRSWREELRAEKQKQFIVMILGAAIVAAGLVFLWKTDMDNRIAYQQSRNAYIETATKKLDQQIKEIQALKKKRDELLARMEVIQDLQGKRPVIVRVFDELVRTLPDGLFYTDLNKRGDTVNIVGMAESNSRISGLMRQFDESDWFADPNLTNVSAADNKRAGYSQFNMSVKQKTPEPEGEDK